VDGSVTSQDGTPAADLNVFIFPVDEALWGVRDRRIKTTRASEAGVYAFDGLPSGECFLCALVEVDRQLMFQPSYLRQLMAASLKLTLGEGERKVQNLRVR
jgi:hypothetical protein